MKQVLKENVYAAAEQSFGIVPPLIKEITEFSVPAAAIYVDGLSTMNASMFSEIERNAIELRISSLNRCESCVKGHSYLLKIAGLDEDDIRAIIEGRPTTIASLDRTIRGTDIIFLANREGYADYATMLSDDFSRQEIFEIIALLSLKTVSNNINNFLKTVRVAQSSAV